MVGYEEQTRIDASLVCRRDEGMQANTSETPVGSTNKRPEEIVASAVPPAQMLKTETKAGILPS